MAHEDRSRCAVVGCPVCGGARPQDLATEPILQFFFWEHLPAELRAVSQPFGDLATLIVETLPRNPERTVALRKLLEAKDAAVRARIFKVTGEDDSFAGAYPAPSSKTTEERKALLERAALGDEIAQREISIDISAGDSEVLRAFGSMPPEAHVEFANLGLTLGKLDLVGVEEFARAAFDEALEALRAKGPLAEMRVLAGTIAGANIARRHGLAG